MKNLCRNEDDCGIPEDWAKWLGDVLCCFIVARYNDKTMSKPIVKAFFTAINDATPISKILKSHPVKKTIPKNGKTIYNKLTFNVGIKTNLSSMHNFCNNHASAKKAAYLAKLRDPNNNILYILFIGCIIYIPQYYYITMLSNIKVHFIFYCH